MVGPLPFLLSVVLRWYVCGIKKAVALQSWHVCSRSAKAPSGGLEVEPLLIAFPLPYLSVNLLQLRETHVHQLTTLIRNRCYSP